MRGRAEMNEMRGIGSLGETSDLCIQKVKEMRYGGSNGMNC